MRALHVFPIFGAELTNGSEYYEYMLTQALVARGVEVDVLATQARQVRATSAFTLRWDADYPPGSEVLGGVTVQRFPARFALPAPAGHALSRLVFRRWRKEEARYGAMLRGSTRLVDHYHLRAQTRPGMYDWLTLAARGPHTPALLRAAKRSLAQYDVLLVGFMPFATLWYLTRLARRAHKPVVLLPLFHPDDLYHHFRVFYRCFTRADGILAQTPHSVALFERLFPGSHPVAVGVGVDAAAFSEPAIDGGRFRAKYDLRDRKIVLFVGRKEHHKRYDLAVQAVEQLADDRVTLVMIGADVDQLPVTSPRVRVLGPLPRAELIDAYDACDVFVLPSEHESFGIVFLEAWMRRKPVIGNAACQPVASVIDDGVDGYLCRDASAIAARLRQLLDEPDTGRALGAAGYVKASTHYTWEAIGGRVHELYTCLSAA